MNDYAALKLTHLRREQAVRAQQADEFREALKDDTPAPALPSLRLRIERWLPRPLRPTTPFKRADSLPVAARRNQASVSPYV